MAVFLSIIVLLCLATIVANVVRDLLMLSKKVRVEGTIFYKTSFHMMQVVSVLASFFVLSASAVVGLHCWLNPGTIDAIFACLSK